MSAYILRLSGLLIVTILLSAVYLVGPLNAQFGEEEERRTPEAILAGAGDPPSREAIIELFENGTSGNWTSGELELDSRQALIDLGDQAAPWLIDEYISTPAVLTRHFFDIIIRGMGYDANQFLLRYLEVDDDYTHYHAGYLSGDTMFAQEEENASTAGPFSEDQEALDALRTALDSETFWRAKAAMLTSLGKSKSPSMVDVIHPHLSDPEQAIRLGAVLGLAEIPHTSAIDALIDAFSDEVMTVRQAAVLCFADEGMGNLGVGKLIDAASDETLEMTVRICALESLRRYIEGLGIDEASGNRNLIFDLAVDLVTIEETELIENWSLVGYAIELIGSTWHPEAETVLEDLVGGSEHPFVAGKLEEALERIEEGPPEVEEDG